MEWYGSDADDDAAPGAGPASARQGAPALAQAGQPVGPPADMHIGQMQHGDAHMVLPLPPCAHCALHLFWSGLK